MARIAKPKVIGKGEKICNGCGKLKPFTDFYTRPTHGTLAKPAVEPGHFISECIECMRTRGNEPRRLEPWISAVKSEQLAIDYFMSNGIWATTGKMTNSPDVDLTLWGAVWCEVKHAHMKSRGYTKTCTFSVTPSQQERGFLAHIVLLICEYPDSRKTFHLFNADHPAFYKDDGKSLKTAFTFTVGKRTPSTRGKGYKHQLTQQVMDSAQDDIGLVWAWLKRLQQTLADGVKPEYGKPFGWNYNPYAVANQKKETA